MKKVKTKSKLEWFKKNIVIVPVVAAIIAGTFTSVRYVLNLTDTITANQETIFKMESKLSNSTADINDLKQRPYEIIYYGSHSFFALQLMRKQEMII